MNKNTIVIILSVIILGLGTFIVFDKVLENKSESNIQENNQLETNKDQVQSYDYAKITEEVNDKLLSFITYRASSKNNTDALDTADFRLDLINSLFMNDNKMNMYNDGVMQSFPYVSYDDYKNLYLEVYGNNYSFEEDLSNASKTVANQNNQYIPSGNISWNGTWGGASKYNLTAENIIYDESSKYYTLTGKYIVEDNSETGTFQIVYNKENISNYLKSIIITQN